MGIKILNTALQIDRNTLVPIKKLSDSAIIPTRGSKYAAGYDFYADIKESVQINPGDTFKVSSGIAIAIPEGCFGGIYPRSGLATKQGLAPANKVGVIDSDYRGPIIVALYNQSNIPQIIHPGDRIAQLIIQPYWQFDWYEVDELDTTDRGEDGFGSTGK
jgi:dUTP pyrophosphatase